MKLGIAYNIFNGEELLEDSLKMLRPISDYIVLVYQTISNVGIKSNTVRDKLEIVEKSLYDKIVQFSPSLKVHPQISETIKREFGRANCRLAGCTHYMSIDCDEFYRKEDFLSAKSKITIEGYDSTACELMNYFHDSSNQIIGNKQYVPFITKITDIGHMYGAPFVVRVDPTRIVPNKRQYCFKSEELIMHHMSYVRADYESIKSKLYNSPNRHLFMDCIDEYLAYYDSWDESQPALNPHEFKRGNKIMPNTIKINNPLNLSIKYTRNGHV